MNINLKDKYESEGMIFSGISPDGKLPEIIELKIILGLWVFSFIQNLNLDL